VNHFIQFYPIRCNIVAEHKFFLIINTTSQFQKIDVLDLQFCKLPVFYRWDKTFPKYG